MKKLKEIYAYKHNDISILVQIDYYNNSISLVEPDKVLPYTDPDTYRDYKAKHYIFSNRGVEYMSGWLNILEAMQEAIKDAKKKYEEELAKDSSFKQSLVESMMNSAANLKNFKNL